METTASSGASRFLLLPKYYSDDQIKEDQMGRACGMYGGERNMRVVLVRKPGGRRPPGRHGHRRSYRTGI
jgi:hypothetical protein